MKLILIFLFVLKSQNAFKIVQDHYWREFDGLLPTDAIPGGTDQSGDTTYIGQFSIAAEYNKELANVHTLVATLYKGKDHAIASYFGRVVYGNETNNIKVLCGNDMSKYKWFNQKTLFAPNCRFVIVGNEDGIPLYVGKADQGREKITGKVFSGTTSHGTNMLSPYQGGEVIHETFEVLTFCN